MTKRLLIGVTLLGATLLLGGCVAYPYGAYAGDPYYYGGGYYGGYYGPAPVYVAPSVGIGFSYSRGWGGRGGGWHGGH